MSPLSPRERDLTKCEDMRIHAERVCGFLGARLLDDFRSPISNHPDGEHSTITLERLSSFIEGDRPFAAILDDILATMDHHCYAQLLPLQLTLRVFRLEKFDALKRSSAVTLQRLNALKRRQYLTHAELGPTV